MSIGKRYTLSAIIFYLILFGLAAIGMCFSPSGPCTPGIGFLFILLVLWLSPIAFLACGVAWLSGRRKYIGPTLISGLVMVGLFLMIRVVNL